MFIPFVTSNQKPNRWERRKGGGASASAGAGKGGSSTGKSSSTSSESESGSTSGLGKTTTVSLSGSTANGKTSATAYGLGGGSIIVIPVGQMFGGRSAGGGWRNQICGTRTYGSGYPGITGRGVTGRGFPFWFWPVVWAAPDGSYLQGSEYGDSYDTNRVGGPMAKATFTSNSSTHTTFHVLSDNSTISSLIASIDANCSSSLSSSSSTSPQVYNASAPGAPQPEQAIQYYRASSIVLTLDGYNNSATLSSDPNATDSPLPSGIDMTLLNCLNQTIVLSAPLVNSASLRWPTGPSGVSLLGSLWLIWWILSLH